MLEGTLTVRHEKLTEDTRTRAREVLLAERTRHLVLAGAEEPILETGWPALRHRALPCSFGLLAAPWPAGNEIDGERDGQHDGYNLLA